MSLDTFRLGIKTYTPDECEEVIKLHQESFEPVELDKYSSVLHRFVGQLNFRNTLVANDGKYIVGFVSFVRLCELLEEQIEHTREKVNFAKKRELSGPLYKSISDLADRLDMPVDCEFFDDRPESVPMDTVLGTELAVNRSYRNKGVAGHLVSEAMDYFIATGEGMPRLFLAEVVEGTFVERACEKQGFKRMFRLGPMYQNGESAVFMYNEP